MIKEFLFTDHELNLVEELKVKQPIRIWNSWVKVIFEYDICYIELECIPELAASQHESDEAMTVRISKKEENYIPEKHSKVLIENPQISEIKTARIFLYATDMITDPVEIQETENSWNKILSFISNLRKSKIEKIFEGLQSSYHSQVVCHPESEEAKNIKSKFSNLIDVGLLLKIGDKYLRLFIVSNGYGFNLDYRPFINEQELNEGIENYQLL